MSRFLLLVSFVAASLLAFTAGSLFAGQERGDGIDKQLKQRELAPYSSLAKALRATHSDADTKVGSKSKTTSKVKSANHKSKPKKLASTKSGSSKKSSLKKSGSSKSRSYHKSRSSKKQISGKGKKLNKTASNRNGKTY
jgi:hypothetical protein